LSYATLLSEEGIKANYLVILKPDRIVTGWQSLGGNLFKVSFTLGHVIAVSQDGSALTEVFVSPSFGEFWWDFDNEELYINVNTPGSSTMVVNYEIYSGTIGTHWYRIPTDDTTRTVYYEPLIIQPPNFKATLSDSLLGFLPSQSSSITIGNPEHNIEEHLYESSFNKKTVDVYHWLDDLDTGNIKLVISALGGNITYTLDRFSISLLDRIDIYDSEWRNLNNSFYNTTDFPSIDPDKIGQPIRFVAGVADSILCTNLDYEADNPTTSTNRIWGAREGALNAVAQTVSAAPASTVTRTYLDDTDGLNIGDSVWLNKATDEYVFITAVNRTGSEYIEHAALVSGAAAPGDTASRGTVAWVGIEQGGVQYKAFYIRDYTEAVSNNVVQLNLLSGAEANLGINTLDSTEPIYARVYGDTNSATIGGSPFGSDSDNFSALTSPAVILYNILKSHIGIAESEINTASFQTLESDIGAEDIGFALPERQGDDFPTYKEVITKIITSNLIQLFLDNDGKWEVSVIKPLTTEDKTIQEDEVTLRSIRYNIRYDDLISDVIVSYNWQEFLDRSDKETASSNTAIYLHGVSKQKTFETYLLESSDASTLADRYSFIFGDRQGSFHISSKNRFFDTLISDIINVEMTKLLGFAYDEDTLRSRDYDVISLDKGLRRVNMVLTDQKGVEDNSGSW
jgi:hypothetical protein